MSAGSLQEDAEFFSKHRHCLCASTDIYPLSSRESTSRQAACYWHCRGWCIPQWCHLVQKEGTSEPGRRKGWWAATANLKEASTALHKENRMQAEKGLASTTEQRTRRGWRAISQCWKPLLKLIHYHYMFFSIKFKIHLLNCENAKGYFPPNISCYSNSLPSPFGILGDLLKFNGLTN